MLHVVGLSESEIETFSTDLHVYSAAGHVL